MGNWRHDNQRLTPGKCMTLLPGRTLGGSQEWEVLLMGFLQSRIQLGPVSHPSETQGLDAVTQMAHALQSLQDWTLRGELHPKWTFLPFCSRVSGMAALLQAPHGVWHRSCAQLERSCRSTSSPERNAISPRVCCRALSRPWLPAPPQGPLGLRMDLGHRGLWCCWSTLWLWKLMAPQVFSSHRHFVVTSREHPLPQNPWEVFGVFCWALL